MPYAIDSGGLADFQKYLVGTWSNKGVPNGKDGKPLSYNVMPLPQVEPQEGYPCCIGYILKNFAFTETIRFNGSAFKGDHGYDPDAVAVTALAPNRGGRYSQFSHALFYDQQVHFAEGPKDGDIVHVENGAWLSLNSGAQKLGPYDDKPAVPGPIVPQPHDLKVAKQIAVPHGNSVLALGSVDEPRKGRPDIPDSDIPYPYPADAQRCRSWDISAYPYYTRLDDPDDFENPNLDLCLNPNRALQDAVRAIKPNHYIYWSVSTAPVKDAAGNEIGRGEVTNIPFEQRRADVTAYKAEYWLLSKNGGKHYDYLAYNQVIDMTIPLKGEEYIFPHVTANTVRRVP